MALAEFKVYIDYNNYVYIINSSWYLIKENELQYIYKQKIIGGGETQESYIGSKNVSNFQDDNPATPYPPTTELTTEQYNQIQNGTFPYGIPPVISRDSSPVQPNLTYNLTWGTGNTFQKLSGKTYVSPSGQRVDCSTLTVTFSSSQHFKKFYATAVKSGNDYGFINDILVDIRETNPTGILLYELTERDANVNFSFTINTSSLTSGDGEYRIGLYVQNDDGFWNYEYFLLEANNLQLEESNNLLLQVPVKTSSD